MYSIQLLELSKSLIDEVLHITGPTRPHAHTCTHTASGKFHFGTENLDCGNKYVTSGGKPEHVLT